MGKRRIRAAVLAGVVLVPGIAIAGLSLAAAHAEQKKTAAPGENYDLGLLGHARGVTDELPAGVDPAAIGKGVVPASVRLIQSGTAGTYWVALDTRGELCLIGAAAESPTAPVSACATTDAFRAKALSLKVGSAAEAYLVPDAKAGDIRWKTTEALRKKIVAGDTVVSVYANLLLLSPAAPAAQREIVTQQTAKIFDLGVLPAG